MKIVSFFHIFLLIPHFVGVKGNYYYFLIFEPRFLPDFVAILENAGSFAMLPRKKSAEQLPKSKQIFLCHCRFFRPEQHLPQPFTEKTTLSAKARNSGGGHLLPTAAKPFCPSKPPATHQG